MRKDFLFIMFLIWMGFLAGCRASKESKARNERTAESEIGVELRKADSLWSSIAERLTMKIEFYPPSGYNECDLGIGTLPTCPQAAQPETVPAGVANPLPWQAQGVGAGGTGAALCPRRQAQGQPNEAKKSLFEAVPLGQAAGSLYRTDGTTPTSEGFGGFGGLGAVKSIEITTERTEDRSVITATDSVLEQKSATTETRQEEKASEARHDNGTVIGVAVVAAVAALVYFLLKQFLKK